MSNLQPASSGVDNVVVKRFIDEVNELIPAKDRNMIFDALKRYQSSMELKRLLQDLTRILDEPSKLEIFEHIRPLIPPKHQLEYDKLAPAPPGRKLRVIKLRRRGNESLGFAVRGGFEHGIGVFVSQVAPGSQAERQGLRVGDELVRVNGYTIAEAIHEEVLNLIKGRDEVELRVTNIGMLPIKENIGDTVTWKYVEKSNRRHSKEKTASKKPQADTAEEVKLFANLRTAPSLGCSIVSGPRNFKGIFVARVTPDGLGAEIGIEVGDQILSVNGTSFLDISRNEAVVALKGSKELNLVIRKRAGLPILQLTSDTNGRSSADNNMVTHPEPEVSSSVPPPPPLEPPCPPHSQEQPRQADLSWEQQITEKQQELLHIETEAGVEYAVVQKINHGPNTSLRMSEENENTKNEESSLMEELRKKLEREMHVKEEVQREVEEENKIKEEIRKKLAEEELRNRMEEEKRLAQEREVKQVKLEHEREATERLQNILQEKLARQRLEEEKLRQEVYEANRKKRNALEHKLLEKIKRHQDQGHREHMLRLQRHHQEEDEIRRETGSVAGADVLSGRGGPLKKQNFGLLGAENSTSNLQLDTAANVCWPVHDKDDNSEVTDFLPMITPISNLDDYIISDERDIPTICVDRVVSPSRSQGSTLPVTFID